MHRRAFTVNPLSLLLIIALIGLVIWKLSYMFNHLPAGYHFMPGAQSKIITIHVFIIIASIALAGGVGAACYFISGRSETAANTGILLTLCLPVATFSYQIYNNVFNPQRPAPPTAPISTSPVPIASNPTPPASRPSPAQPPAIPVTTPRPVETPISATPAPVPAANPAPATEWTDAAVKAREVFVADLDAAAASFITKFNEVATPLAKAPPTGREALKTRLTSLQTANQSATSLRSRFHDADTQLARRLSAAGLDDHTATSLAIRFTSDARYMRRAGACDECIRLFDAATEQTTLLRDNLGRWHPQGTKAVSNDKSIDFKLRAAASRLDMYVARREQIVNQLRGN